MADVIFYSPLAPVTVRSIYGNGPLPERMARCTPDTKLALIGVAEDLRSLGHEIRLSDLFRSYAMQKAANADYVEKRKKAYSPPPGASMHEAGRAMDIDLSSIGVPLARLWEIARARGFYPIIDAPIAGKSESWHFDCRGSHQKVYEYTKAGAYAQMAHSAILSLGVQVDQVHDQATGFIQSGLIRLGFDPGGIDGVFGEKTRIALREAGVDEENAAAEISVRVKAAFPGEYSGSAGDSGTIQSKEHS